MNSAITGILCFYRDELKLQAKLVLEPAELHLKDAKSKYHDAKILSNKLVKRAQEVQDLITTEMQDQYNQDVAVQQAYEYHQPNQSENSMTLRQSELHQELHQTILEKNTLLNQLKQQQ